jgi:GNAT superfamily N-acetyltransferase
MNAKPPGLRLRFRPLPVTPAALRQLMELFRHAYWTDRRTAKDVRRMLRYTPFTLSAWQGDRLVAFCRVLTDFTYRAVLYDVIVHPDFRGQGVAKQLMQKLHTHPKLRRIESWYLSTRNAHGLYSQFGWVHNPVNFMEFKRLAKAPPKRIASCE